MWKMWEGEVSTLLASSWRDRPIEVRRSRIRSPMGSAMGSAPDRAAAAGLRLLSRPIGCQLTAAVGVRQLMLFNLHTVNILIDHSLYREYSAHCWSVNGCALKIVYGAHNLLRAGDSWQHRPKSAKWSQRAGP